MGRATKTSAAAPTAEVPRSLASSASRRAISSATVTRNSITDTRATACLRLTSAIDGPAGSARRSCHPTISSLKERSLSRGRRRLRCRFLLRDELRSRMTGARGWASGGPRTRRTVKVGRRPPVGAALTARSAAVHTIECEAPSGLRARPPLGAGARGRSGSISRASRCWRANPETRVPFISSSSEATWSGSAATPWAQSVARPRRSTGAMKSIELAKGCVRPGSHPVLARQRISPSRRP